MLVLTATLHTGCSKDDKEEPPKEATKLELITKGPWVFEKATASGADISDRPELVCYIDNSITFSAATAVISEGAKVCTPPSPTTPFNWTFKNNETVINTTAALIPGGSGDFTIVTLTDKNLVISQNVKIAPSPVALPVVVTFKH